MNRYLSPGPEGELQFRRGRRYRMTIVVNGVCDAEDLDAQLGAYGFVGIASSTPATWPEDKPKDWPHEALPRIAANECPVRVSCLFADEEPITFLPDWSIGETGASATIVLAWDVGQASPAETTGGASAAAAAPDSPKPKSTVPYAVAAVIGLGGVVVFNHWQAQRRMELETKRLESAEVEQERQALKDRLQRLVSRHGYTPDEAERVLEREEEQLEHANLIYVVPTVPT